MPIDVRKRASKQVCKRIRAWNEETEDFYALWAPEYYEISFGASR